MFNWDEKLIKKYCGVVTFDRAHKIYLANNVKCFNEVIEDNSNMKIIEATVNSLEDKKDIKAIIMLEMNNNTVEFECECTDFKMQKNNKACKHVAAVLLRYIKGEIKEVRNKINLNEQSKSKDYLIEKKDQTLKMKVPTNALIDTVSKPEIKMVPKVQAKVALKLELNINFYLQDDLKTTYIEIKIGEKIAFMINDVRAFLTCLKYKNKYDISNNFAYDPAIHCFRKEDVDIIKLIAASNKLAGKKYVGEKVYIQDDEVDKLFKILNTRSFNLILNNKLYKSIKIIYADMPLQFEITQEKDKVILKQLSEMPIALTESKEFYFLEQMIYKPSSVQAYRYEALYSEFVVNSTTEKTYKEKDVKRTRQLLEFKLKDISKNLIVNKPVRDKLEEYHLKTKIYIDYIKTGVLIRIVFIYGEIELDLLSKSKYEISSKIAKRDYQSEKNVVDLIKSYKFSNTLLGFLLNNEDEELIVKFIKYGICKLEKIAEVKCSDEFKNIKIYEASEYLPEIKLYNHYFDFSFNVDDVSYRDTINIFQALKDDQTYYKLDNGNFISLKNNELNKISNIIGEREIENKSLIKGRYTVSRSVSALSGRVYDGKTTNEEDELRRQMANEKMYLEKNNRLKEIITSIEKVKDEVYFIPPELEFIMREYQKIGFRWFKTLASQKIGGIMADEMGLGKTLQAIALILDYVEQNKESRKPAIVVAPTSLIYNWENEIKKFAPQLNTITIYGSQKARKNLREEIETADIIVTSYPLVGRDIEEYSNMEFSYIFIDEAQQIKNPRTMASKAVKLINAEGRFALTGTPIENSLSELWSIFDFIMPGYLLSYRQFKEHYEVPIMSYNDKKALDNLNSIIKPFILRRLKREVLLELPDKIEQKLIVDMTFEQKEAYIQCLNYSKQSINTEINEKGYSRSQIHILAALSKLRQVCCDPSIVMEDYFGESAKMLALDTIVEESIVSGHRILIFSQFVKVLQIIKARLMGNNVRCFYLDGSVKSQERIRLVEEFNLGKAEVFLISLKAGGFGLNLTGADVVIHFDPWWNPAVEEQATDRAHRIGQTKTVEVIKLITKGTIEEKILKLHERKKGIANSIMSDKDNEENFITSMSKDEIEDLFIVSPTL